MNLLVTGAWNCTNHQLEELKKLGHTIKYMQQEKCALPCEYSWVEGVICNGLFLTHPIEKFVNLKYIQLTSAGTDRVPVGYLIDRGIILNNARGVYSVPMAEFVVSGILNLYKNQHGFWQNRLKKQWVKDRNLVELAGKTVCIVGCGSVGQECAKRFSAFDCEIVGIDLVSFDNKWFKTISPLSELPKLLTLSDIVILTLPLSERTEHLFNKDLLLRMKRTAIIANISRGGVLSEEDLIEALLKKTIAGAVLDVFEREPLDDDSPLWDMENVIITPHNSFVGDGNSNRLFELIKANLEVEK